MLSVTYKTGCIFYSGDNFTEAPRKHPIFTPLGHLLPNPPSEKCHDEWQSLDCRPITGKDGMSGLDLANQVQLLKMWSVYRQLRLLQWSWYTVNIREATLTSSIPAFSIFIEVSDETHNFHICFSSSLEHISLEMFPHTHPCIFIWFPFGFIFQPSLKMAFPPLPKLLSFSLSLWCPYSTI